MSITMNPTVGKFLRFYFWGAQLVSVTALCFSIAASIIFFVAALKAKDGVPIFFSISQLCRVLICGLLLIPEFDFLEPIYRLTREHMPLFGVRHGFTAAALALGWLGFTILGESEHSLGSASAVTGPLHRFARATGYIALVAAGLYLAGTLTWSAARRFGGDRPRSKVTARQIRRYGAAALPGGYDREVDENYDARGVMRGHHTDYRIGKIDGIRDSADQTEGAASVVEGGSTMTRFNNTVNTSFGLDGRQQRWGQHDDEHSDDGYRSPPQFPQTAYIGGQDMMPSSGEPSPEFPSGAQPHPASRRPT